MTLNLCTTSHNLSFLSPWKLVHLNRTQNFAQSVVSKFLEVSALENCKQNANCNIARHTWRLLKFYNLSFRNPWKLVPFEIVKVVSSEKLDCRWLLQKQLDLFSFEKIHWHLDRLQNFAQFFIPKFLEVHLKIINKVLSKNSTDVLKLL